MSPCAEASLVLPVYHRSDLSLKAMPDGLDADTVGLSFASFRLMTFLKPDTGYSVLMFGVCLL